MRLINLHKFSLQVAVAVFRSALLCLKFHFELEKLQPKMEVRRRLSNASDAFEDAEDHVEADEGRGSALSPAVDKAIKDYLVSLIKKFCMKTPLFVDVKTDEGILAIFKELETWDPPEYLLKSLPIYFTGRSADGKPIWIVEAGKCDLSALLKQGPDVLGAMDKTFIHWLQVTVKSMFVGGEKPEFKPGKNVVDLDGMHFGQFYNPSVMAMTVTYIKRYKSLVACLFDERVYINSNYLFEFFVNKLRPLIRKILKRTKIYGKDESIWKPILQKTFPRTALPEIYGGTLRDTAYAHEYKHLYLNFAFDSPMLKKDFVRI